MKLKINKLQVDGHDIFTMPRWDAETFSLDKPYIVVSITDAGSPPANFRNDLNRKAIIRLSFQDAYIGDIKSEDAKKVWEFVESYWNNVEALVCHCEFGHSRSPGLAAAITKLKGGNEFFWFSHGSPSKFVYYKILEAASDSSTDK